VVALNKGGPPSSRLRRWSASSRRRCPPLLGVVTNSRIATGDRTNIYGYIRLWLWEFYSEGSLKGLDPAPLQITKFRISILAKPLTQGAGFLGSNRQNPSAEKRGLGHPGSK